MSSLGGKALRTIKQKWTASPQKNALESAKHITLRNLPQTTTSADLRRIFVRRELQGVDDVAIDYDRFQPTGKALITLTRPEFLRDNLRILDKFTVSGIPVTAEPCLIEDKPTPSRMRGAKGRAEAKERGIVTGCGPHAGITNGDKHVIIIGLPGKFTPQNLLPTLDSFTYGEYEIGSSNVVKVEKPNDEFSMYSRFLVRMPSVSEAHRLVRQLHLTFYDQERYGTRFRLRARVVD